MDIEFRTGDIIIDMATGDVGLLVNRYAIFDIDDGYSEEDALGFPPNYNIWAWDIYWAGGELANTNISRYQPYTEEGLGNLIRAGTFRLESHD